MLARCKTLLEPAYVYLSRSSHYTLLSLLFVTERQAASLSAPLQATLTSAKPSRASYARGETRGGARGRKKESRFESCCFNLRWNSMPYVIFIWIRLWITRYAKELRRGIKFDIQMDDTSFVVPAPSQPKPAASRSEPIGDSTNTARSLSFRAFLRGLVLSSSASTCFQLLPGRCTRCGSRFESQKIAMEIIRRALYWYFDDRSKLFSCKFPSRLDIRNCASTPNSVSPFLFDRTAARRQARRRQRWPVDTAEDLRRTIRHEDKVRARSYLKVRYAIGDISMPNISHKAAPHLPVILNIIYARSYKDSGACLPGPCSPHDDAPSVVCVFHTSTYHATINRRARCAHTTQHHGTQRTANRKTISIHCFVRPINIVNIGLLNYRSNLVRRSADLRRVLHRKLASPRRTSASAADIPAGPDFAKKSAFDSPFQNRFDFCSFFGKFYLIKYI